jgi:tellurite resistance protein TerC
MATHDEVDIKIEANPVLRLMRRLMPVSPSYDGQAFFTKQTVAGRARWLATPLFVVLVMVDVVDLIFAVDSIPAIFAITADPFIIFTSNVFAILGLRSMYFLLAGIIEKFHYLKLGLAAVLTFVGVKMLITYFETEIPISISLGVVGGVLALSVIASVVFPKKEPPFTVVEEDTGVTAPREDDRVER